MSSMTCERCGTNEGTPHTFHYGRSVPPDAIVGPPADPPEKSAEQSAGQSAEAPEGVVYHASAYLTDIGSHETFQLSGTEAVALCKRCLDKARRHHAARMLGTWARHPLVAGAYVVLAVGAIAWAVAGDWVQAAIWLGVALVVTVIAYGAAYVALEDEDFAEHTAVDVHAERLRAQGYDAFWTHNELGHFVPH